MSDQRIIYPLSPIVSTTANSNSKIAKQPVTVAAPKFQAILRKELSEVKFSQHALQRLDERDIKLDQEQVLRLQTAVDKAEQKGSRESLVLMDNQLAFVVSVRNRTVITAMDGASIRDNVFTNIDSAIIM